MEEKKPYIQYEYKKLTVPQEQAMQTLDSYAAFGWQQDEREAISAAGSMAVLHLKRDRKLVNRAELTRLQRQFEATQQEVEKLKRACTSAATAASLAVGLVGTAFMAGSVFAVTHEPPKILLCVLLAIPAFAGWALPYFLYRRMVFRRTQQLQPLIEDKQEELYTLCEKGSELL